MDGLVLGFVVALLAGAGDRPPWLLAILADRYRTSVTLAVAALLANTANCAIAVVGAALVAPVMNPNARALLLGIALVAAAAGTLFAPKPPADRLERWRIGGFATTLLGLFILAFGDRTQFAVFGVAVAGSSMALTASGAAIGSTAACLIGLALGERAWLRLPWRGFRWSATLLLGIGGLWSIGQALRLI